MKKYLNSVEEVVKALKEGQKLFESFKSGDTEQIKEITLIDGIICTKDDIGYGIHLLSACKYYTEEPEPLKFEVNRAYKTRECEKAFLANIEKKDNEIILLFIGITENTTPFKFRTNENGVLYSNKDSRLDIVGYWEEEK